MPALADLLLKNRKFSPTYHSKVLANHLSMALIALDKLGASFEQLNKYYENYATDLEPVPGLSSHIIDDSNWMDFLGCSHYHQNYLGFFQNRIQSIGIDNTLKNYLQVLIKGVSGQAFHCLIRLAYAIEIKDADEIAFSLAYWACHYLILGDKKGLLDTLDNPYALLNKINNINNFSGTVIDGINLTERFKKVAGLPEFSPIIDWLKMTNTTLSEFATILITLYAQTKDFTALHMVTATHAMRIILPYLVYQEGLRYYVQAICVAYISMGSPNIPNHFIFSNQPISHKIHWPTIFRKATYSTDEHVIKLVYTCYEEDKIYQNQLYGYVAAEEVKSLC